MHSTPSFYVIAYDLRKPGQDFDLMEKKINELPVRLRIQKSVWIVRTKRTSQEILDLVKPAFDRNDKVFVARIDIVSSRGGFGSAVRQWITKQIAWQLVQTARKARALRDQAR